MMVDSYCVKLPNSWGTYDMGAWLKVDLWEVLESLAQIDDKAAGVRLGLRKTRELQCLGLHYRSGTRYVQILKSYGKDSKND